MNPIKSKTIINQLLQSVSEDAEQAVSGGAAYIKFDGIDGNVSSAEASTSSSYQGKRSSGGYVPT